MGSVCGSVGTLKISKNYQKIIIDRLKLSEPFQDGGRYHIETSPLICGLRLERVKLA